MLKEEYRVFISAVTSEFGKAREELASDLRARGLMVKVQRDFRQETKTNTTLEKLRAYIQSCNAVVCIVGKRSGSFPPRFATDQFLDVLPPGVRLASYTQWEFFLARTHQKRLSLYIARDDYQPDQRIVRNPDINVQRIFVRNSVLGLGLDFTNFSNADQLCRAVLKEDWPITYEDISTKNRLKIIYDQLRDARLGQKYYGYKINYQRQLYRTREISQFKILYKQYTDFVARLRFLVDEIKANSQLSDKNWASFRRLRQRVSDVEKDEPAEDESLVLQLQEEVKLEFPRHTRWYPGDDAMISL